MGSVQLTKTSGEKNDATCNEDSNQDKVSNLYLCS